MEGKVIEAKYSYQRKTFVKPNIHYYAQGCVKYSCPVCDALDNKHQVSYGLDSCPLCNVNLIWSDFE
jgi:hypothetical protein